MTPTSEEIQRAAIATWERKRSTEEQPGPDPVTEMFPGDPWSLADPQHVTAVEIATRPVPRYALQTLPGYAAITLGQVRSHLRRWGALHYIDTEDQTCESCQGTTTNAAGDDDCGACGGRGLFTVEVIR